jgi:hypothetical protein
MQTTRTIRTFGRLIALTLLMLILTPVAPRTAAATTYVQPAWGRMPLLFIANQGQVDERIAFYVQGHDKTLYFTPEGVTFALTAPIPQSSSTRGEGEMRDSPLRSEPVPQVEGEGPGERVERWIVKLDFVGANAVRPGGQEQTDTVVSYFKGPREEWRTGLPTYSRIVYPDLWTGIDLAYSGTANRLKYEFVVQPGADPARIRLAYRGATVGLNAAGQLEVSTPAGGFQDDAPIAYQEVNGRRVPVEVAYALEDAATYGFRLGAYDPAVPLVIDPAVLVYCGFIGGSGIDDGNGIAVDAAGNAYVTGTTESTETTFPVTGGPDLDHNGGNDAFVAKVKTDGTGLDYCGFIGGSGNDYGFGIAVDGDGNAYVTGYTGSTEATFPVIGGPDLTHNGGNDAFVAKVKADGTGLDYCGYIGGNSTDYGRGIAVDEDGSAYVTGSTESTGATFPVTGGPDLIHNGGGADAFVAKVKADGTGLDYCGYIGGSGYDVGYGIAVDAVEIGRASGWERVCQATFPVTGGPDLTHNGGDFDAFVAKVKADGTGLDYCGYIGGSGYDVGYGIAVDAVGNAYVTGFAGSTEATFPVTGGPDLTHNGSTDAFVAKVKADGTVLDYCGYIGGSDSDGGRGIAVDEDGNAYVTGDTWSTETTFPEAVGPDLDHNGGIDAFVTRVKVDGTGLDYCGFIGGSGSDYGNGIAVDGDGSTYVTGETRSTEATFPVTGGPDLTHNGDWDAFVAKVSYSYKESSTTTMASSLNPSTYGKSVTFTATVSGDVDMPTGAVQFKVDGANLGAPVPLSGGTASISTAALGVGTYTVTAEYGGDVNYVGSTGTLSGGQVVNKAATTMVVTSSLNPSVVGRSVAFTATVSATSGTPSGTVQFKVDGVNLGAPLPLSGGTASISTAALGVGTCTVTAEYSGDVNYIGSTGTLSGGQVVNVKVYLPLVLRQNP